MATPNMPAFSAKCLINHLLIDATSTEESFLGFWRFATMCLFCSRMLCWWAGIPKHQYFCLYFQSWRNHLPVGPFLATLAPASLLAACVYFGLVWPANRGSSWHNATTIHGRSWEFHNQHRRYCAHGWEFHNIVLMGVTSIAAQAVGGNISSIAVKIQRVLVRFHYPFLWIRLFYE